MCCKRRQGWCTKRLQFVREQHSTATDVYTEATAHEWAKTIWHGTETEEQREWRLQQMRNKSTSDIVLRVQSTTACTKSHFVHRFYFLTNLLLDQKCSLEYQHMQLMIPAHFLLSLLLYNACNVDITPTVIKSLVQLVMAHPTMSYIFLVVLHWLMAEVIYSTTGAPIRNNIHLPTLQISLM